MRLIRLALILPVLAVPFAIAEAQPTTPPEVREPVDFTIKVVPLTYARATELAYTLALVAPAGIRVVPYNPTNSLLIAGPRTSVEQLINLIKPSNRE
jgi:hypothetical protein